MFLTTFLALFDKIIPLYAIIIAGYVAARVVRIDGRAVATLLIYIIVPVVVFDGAARAALKLNILSLPILFFLLACFSCGIFYFLGRFIWSGSEKNVIAYGAGTGNTGYFGLPVAMALFGEKVVPIVVLSIFGFLIYEVTLGLFTALKGKFTFTDSVKKLIRLPAIYAFFLGLIVNILGVKFGSEYNALITRFHGAYTILGMMVIGMGVAQITEFKIDGKFIGIAFLAKFVSWPLLVGAIVIIDKSTFHFFTPQIYSIMLLISVVPMSANSVAYATLFKIHPEKVALAVVLSAIFALLYVPLMLALVTL